ncbi:sacsin N-terminal ATP-binding-like domain-containing protein [Promicromonospora soli]
MTRDPFGTGALRRAVTEAWRASPTRFREDANSEEDHARGYYRDRVVVELAQNAADAAARAGVPGRLTLRLEPIGSGEGGRDAGWRLVAANTGAPLDADGVASLASLRASAKVSGTARWSAGAGRDALAGWEARAGGDATGAGGDVRAGGDGAGVVGRFGVGFAAVRSVSDEILVRSRDGGVRFSLAATRAELGLGPTSAGDAEVRPSARIDAELGPLSSGDGEIGPLPPDRSNDGPMSWQPTDLASAAEQGTDLASAAEHPTDLGTDDARIAGLRDEARARGDALPVLRLPFPAPGTAPDEPDTVVELVLRDAEAVAAVRAQLAALDDALLLALPALDEVVIENDFAGQLGYEPSDAAPSGSPRVLRDVAARWRVHRTSGALAPDSTLPTEARRPDWSVLWALPTTGSRAAESAVLHAPTPTDVRLSFPALLIASFPVDPGRRGVLPGPTTERVAAAAGRAYAALLGELGAERDVLGLVPTGLPAGEVDAGIRAAAADALRATPLLPLSAPEPPAVPVEDEPGAAPRVAPSDAAFLAGPLGEDPALARALALGSPVALVTVPVRHQALVRSLGAEPLDVADLAEALPPEPGVVHDALDALAPHAGDPAVLEAIAGAPLPLADGRVTRGARGTVLLDAPHLAGITRALGVRVVHPDAAHPVLERAGAARTTPRGLLADAAVRSTALAATEQVLDGGDADQLGAVLSAQSSAGSAGSALEEPAPAETIAAVLELVHLAIADSGPGDLPFWLGELPVVADGDLAPLRETALPGTWAARNLDLPLVHDDVAARWGSATLGAAGARADLGVYRVADVVTADGDDADYGADDPAGWLSDWDEYLEHLADELGAGAWIGDVEAVPDLDALRDAAGTEPAGAGPLAAALARIAADPDLRRAVLTPARSPDAPGREAASYTAWFLRRRLGAPFALGDTPLLPPAPAEATGLDTDLLAALGGRRNLADLPGREWPALLERLPEAQGEVPTGLSVDVARAVWAGLAALARADDSLAISPSRLPALGPAGVTVERTDDLAVATSPQWAQLGPVVPAPADVGEALADLLDLPLEGTADISPDEPGEPAGLDPRLRTLVPGMPDQWRRHDVLTVEGNPVTWWVSDAVAHAVSPEGLARALAELTGADALLLEAALRDPARAERLSAERAWG